MSMYRKLSYILSRKDKILLILLLLFTICYSLFETLSVTALMSFISVVSDFALIHSNKYYSYIYELFGFFSDKSFLVWFACSLIALHFIRVFVNVLYSYVLSSFGYGKYYKYSIGLFNKYLRFSYKFFATQNTADMNKAIIVEAKLLAGIFSSVINILAEVFVIIFLYLFLIFFNWKVTLGLSLVLLFELCFIFLVVSKKIFLKGEQRHSSQNELYRVINETFGSYKLIKLLGNIDHITKRFSKASHLFSRVHIVNAVLKYLPKLLLETSGFVALILIILYLLIFYKDPSLIISMVAMYAMAFYRFLPSVNKIVGNFNSIAFNKKSIDVVYEHLNFEDEKIGYDNIDFDHNIKLKKVCFSYGTSNVINDVSIIIKKGHKYGFVGESGSGKSTLVDIIAGIYQPSLGNLLVDEVPLSSDHIGAWRSKFGYIPQHVYLFAGTIEENVVFGRTYDKNKVVKVLKKAKIYDFLMSKEGLHTHVGEGGITLSGGQKQRIAIARALYHDPEILIMDEATSALDMDTEQRIMEEIYQFSEKKTLIIVAHRLSTLEKCDYVFGVSDNQVKLLRPAEEVNEL